MNETELMRLKDEERRRWGDPASYKLAWNRRSQLAAELVPDGVSLLEIGVGTGVFRGLVSRRTKYVGADLQPLDETTIALDLDCDPLPHGRFDYAVLLGVFTYLHQPEAVAQKLCAAAAHVIVSYCCRRPELSLESVVESRRARGWVNHFTKRELVEIFSRHGHEPATAVLYNATDELEEFVMIFRRSTRSQPVGDDVASA